MNHRHCSHRGTHRSAFHSISRYEEPSSLGAVPRARSCNALHGFSGLFPRIITYLWFGLVLGSLLVSIRAVAAADPHQDQLQPFVAKYCLHCHGEKTQKGDRRFDEWFAPGAGPRDAELLQEMLDQLNLAAMPPEDAKQPSVAEIQRVVNYLTVTLAKARAAAKENAGQQTLQCLFG